jgi:DNA-binding MarR family transcriptional regulator
MAPREEIGLHDIQALAEFRYNIRRFLRASEQLLKNAGLKPQQYQLLLHIKGLPANQPSTITAIAERLQIQHHSTVELVDRLADKGFVRRKRGGEDRRQVLLELTPKGEKIIRELAMHHREELRDTGPALVSALRKVIANAHK